MKTFKIFIEEKLDKNYILSLAKKGKIEIDDIDMHELKLGVKTEREHTGTKGKDTIVAKNDTDVLKIAVAHLREDEKYYTKLIKAKL